MKFAFVTEGSYFAYPRDSENVYVKLDRTIEVRPNTAYNAVRLGFGYGTPRYIPPNDEVRTLRKVEVRFEFADMQTRSITADNSVAWRY